MVKKMNKIFIHLLALIVCIFGLSTIFIQNVSATTSVRRTSVAVGLLDSNDNELTRFYTYQATDYAYSINLNDYPTARGFRFYFDRFELLDNQSYLLSFQTEDLEIFGGFSLKTCMPLDNIYVSTFPYGGAVYENSSASTSSVNIYDSANLFIQGHVDQCGFTSTDSITLYFNLTPDHSSKNIKLSFATLSITDTSELNYLFQILEEVRGISGVSKEDVTDAVNDSLDEQENKDEQKGQEAQDTTEETQSQVDNKTQNLFSFITSFFGAFTSASPSNCNFDWGLADKGFGVIDMCQTNIPAELQSILSIVSILIVVPMVLWLINSIVNAFKEFQQ